MYKKYRNQLPNYLKLNDFFFDIERLRIEAKTFCDEFQTLDIANGKLVENHVSLYEQSKKSLFEVPLTHPIVQQAAENISFRKSLAVSSLSYDERNPQIPTDKFSKSYFNDCVKQFGCQIYRVRLSKLIAGGVVDWHIDYDPGYAFRIVIPIFTNDSVMNLTKRENTIEEKFLPADGGCWFLNTGFSHRVENNGSSDRIALLVSLNGEEIIKRIGISGAN